MEEMTLVIVLGVPYEIEITANGIPVHEAKIEFSIIKNDISYNFPVKMISDKKFVFTITDDAKHLVNNTHEYKLYVYYGNARFEADTGSFNLIDKQVFDVKMGKKDNVNEKTPKDETPPETTEEPSPKEENIVVTPTEEKKTPKPKKDKPAITPTVKKIKEGLISEKEFDARIRNIINHTSKKGNDEEEDDGLKKGKFFEDIDRMKDENERRRKERAIKLAIKESTRKNN
jgi:hypothetical protein